MRHYFICLGRYIPELNKFFYNNIACVETNDSAVNVSWRWRFHSNATVFANVFPYDKFSYLHSLVPRETSLLEVSYTYLFSNLVLENLSFFPLFTLPVSQPLFHFHCLHFHFWLIFVLQGVDLSIYRYQSQRRVTMSSTFNSYQATYQSLSQQTCPILQTIRQTRPPLSCTATVYSC